MNGKMKIGLIGSVVACMISFMYGCPPGPSPVVPVPDANDGAMDSVCASACAALRLAGCPIGNEPNCVVVMNTINTQADHPNAVTNKPLTCTDVAAVKTKADAVRLSFTCQ